MSKRMAVILEDCLQRLDRGASLIEVLAEYPEREDELKQLLLVAMASRAFPVPIPSQIAQRLGRNQMLAEMNRLEIIKSFRKRSSIPLLNRGVAGLVKSARIWGLNRLAYSYRLATVLVVFAISGGLFTLNASASSQPGDLLYSLKLGLERVGLVSSVPEDLSPQPPFQNEVDLLSAGQGGGNNLEFQLENYGFFEPFPGLDLGLLTVDAVKGEQETDKDQKEADKEEEKDLKVAEKEAEKDQKQAEKETEKEQKKDYKEAEKDQKEAEREAEKDQKEAEKETKKDQKVEEKLSEKSSKEKDKKK